jgi:hypothetical protein
MKISKELLLAMGVLCMTSGIAMADDSIQAYAHPTLFGSEGHSLVTTDSDTIIGGKVYKPCHVKTLDKKQNVVIGRYAKQMLSDMQSKMDAKRGSLYDPKMPVLRSELAYFISEGLGLSQTGADKYSDVTDAYWAKDEIDRVLKADVMIGYPDATFKPDKAITKAEVFCTFAKLMELPTSTEAPTLNGQTIQYIPTWAYAATNEVVNSGLLSAVPDTDKVINDEYLSKEQVAYFISAMKKNFKIDLSNGAIGCASKYEPVEIKIKLSERLSARTSNVGETFSAKTTEDATIAGTTFPAGSTVYGKVTSVARPGVNTPGYIEVQFDSIKNGDTSVDFPKQISNASVDVAKNPNIASRLLGSPVSMVARTAGVAGRTVSSTAEVVANGTEEIGSDLSDALSDTFSLHPLKGLKSVGSGVVAVGKGVYDISKLAVSGTFGVVYELVDEAKYIIVPNTTNDSSLNPDEELTIVF